MLTKSEGMNYIEVHRCLKGTDKKEIIKAGFHMIADDRRSQIAESSAIIYGNRSSAMETYPIIFLILTDDSTLLNHKARMFFYSNAHLL